MLLLRRKTQMWSVMTGALLPPRTCTCHSERPLSKALSCLRQAQNSVSLRRLPATRSSVLCRRIVCTATADLGETALDPAERIAQLKAWLQREHNMPREALKLQLSPGVYASAEDFRATDSVKVGEIFLDLPADTGVTATDAHNETRISGLTEGRSELVCLALWLLSERAQGDDSPWRTFLASLPQQTETPILWGEEERKRLLRGSPVAEQAAARSAAIDAEWESLEAECSAAPDRFPPGVFCKEAFRAAMSVVFAHAAFLDSAQCFALLPIATLLKRTGREDAAQIDFDLESQSVRVRAGRPYGQGEQIAVYDGRPNGELFLATGTLEDGNPADCLTLRASLVRADRLYSGKKAILESLGFTADEEFPIFEDRMPVQLLAYLRLSRLQDPAQLAMVSFDRDTIINQNNEYEILQLLLGDCRERLSAYQDSAEDCIKRLQRRDLSTRERLATRLILSEQRVLQGTVSAVRRKLAPIRGIPTKSGAMSDPNEDLKDIFATLEGIPRAPARLFEGLASWARGEQDPTWKKRQRPPRRRP